MAYFSKGFNEIVVGFAECLSPGEVDKAYKESQAKAIEALLICCGRLKGYSQAAFLLGIQGIFEPEKIAESMKASATYANRPKPTKEDVSGYQNSARKSITRCMKEELGIKEVTINTKTR